MKFSEQNDSQICAIGEPMWRNIIDSTNNGDYAAFCRDLSVELKQSVSEERFNKQNEQVQAIDGEISADVDFLGLLRSGIGVCLLYRVRFTKSGDEALGRMTLNDVDGQVKVSNININ